MKKYILISLLFTYLTLSSCLRENSVIFVNDRETKTPSEVIDSTYQLNFYHSVKNEYNPDQTTYQEDYFKTFNIWDNPSDSKHYQDRPVYYIVIKNDSLDPIALERMEKIIPEYLYKFMQSVTKDEQIASKASIQVGTFCEYFNLPQSKLINISAMKKTIKKNNLKISKINENIKQTFENFKNLEIAELTMFKANEQYTPNLSEQTKKLLEYYLKTYNVHGFTFSQKNILQKLGVTLSYPVIIDALIVLTNLDEKENKSFEDFLDFLKENPLIPEYISGTAVCSEKDFLKKQNEYLEKIITIFRKNRYAENSSIEGTYINPGFILALIDNETPGNIDFIISFEALKKEIKKQYNVNIILETRN